MFGHRVSKIGYVLAIVAVVLLFGPAWFEVKHPTRNTLEMFGGIAFVLSFCTVFLGVIARGFERVEAAILSRPIARIDA
ncbi:hypothetical protein [Rhizobium sp. LjRoot254]|uniref:hypothetical protein n=1 Tax=Rhizobium sp. LjRoot254 TaxID=3342297 RepID=UPI003ECD92F0